MEKAKLVPVSEVDFSSEALRASNRGTSRLPDAKRISDTFSEAVRHEASVFFGAIETAIRNDDGNDGGSIAEWEVLKKLHGVDFSMEFLSELAAAFDPDRNSGRLAKDFGYSSYEAAKFPFAHRNFPRELALSRFDEFLSANQFSPKTFVENWGHDSEIANAAFSKFSAEMADNSLRNYGFETPCKMAAMLVGAPAFSGNRIEAYEDLVIIGKGTAAAAVLSMEGIPQEIVEFCVGIGYGTLAVKQPLSQKSRTSIINKLINSNLDRQDSEALKTLLSNPCLSGDDVDSVVNACVFRNPRLGKDFLELAAKHPQFRRDSLSKIVSEAAKSNDAQFAKELTMAACLSPMFSQEDVDVLWKAARLPTVSAVLYAYRPSFESRGMKVPRISIPTA